MNVHDSILTPTQVRLLHVLGPFATTAGFYLAGGTAIALRFGHRRSDDFDWFQPTFEGPEDLMPKIKALGLALDAPQIEAGTLNGRIDGVKVQFLAFNYPLLDSLNKSEDYGANIASVRDLAAMKLLAVAQRGSRKDFIDVHEVLHQGGRLSDMLQDFRVKFQADSITVLRGLTYFDDAEKEPMPAMLNATGWDTVRRDITRAVREVTL